MQRRLLGVEERLEPGEGVLVLQRGIPGADDAQHLAVRRAPNGSVIDLGLCVGGDEGDQIHGPVQARLLGGRLPVVKVGFLKGGSQPMPRELAEVSHRFDLVCHPTFSIRECRAVFASTLAR